MSLANPAIRAKTLHYDYKMLLAKPVYSKKPCKASVQTPIMTPTIDPNLITGLKAMDRRALSGPTPARRNGRHMSVKKRIYMIKFSELNLNPKVLKAVEEAGYETPTPIQEGAIPPALEGPLMFLASRRPGQAKRQALLCR